LTFNLDDSKLAVFRRLTRLEATKVLADCVKDLLRAAKHAGRRGADLYEVLTDGLTGRTKLEVEISQRILGKPKQELLLWSEHDQQNVTWRTDRLNMV
jgi:hypothetical protein